MIVAIVNLWPWVRVTNALLDDNWLNHLASYHHLFVGFSGGLDSTVLLHRLSQIPVLASKLSAIHVHHGLSLHADAWLLHCQTICASLSIPITVRVVEFEQRFNLEEHARKARYDAFLALIGENDGLLLGHHADDQAETLLLQLLRGAGVDGLAAMPAIKPLGLGQLLRPFLKCSRAALEAYAHVHKLTWIDDESNQDSTFSRNYLRHQVMPLLRDRWPGVVNNLARTALHCQDAKANLHALAELDCPELIAPSDTLSISPLLIEKTQDHARLGNVLRTWLINNDVRLPSTATFNRIIHEVIDADKDAVPCVEWEGVRIRRYRDKLYLLKQEPIVTGSTLDWHNFPAPLEINHQNLCATLSKTGLFVPLNSRVQIKFRQGGEQLCSHGQTKTLKKLLQEWHVPPWQRDTIPLVYVGDELVAVVGFAIDDRFYTKNQANTYQIDLV